MAEKYVQNTKYQYGLNASLVIQGNPSGPPRQGDEPSGEGTTLAGKQLAGFGDRVEKTKPAELKDKAAKKLEKQAKSQHTEVLRRKKKQAGASSRQTQSNARDNVLNVEIQEDLVYRPTTKETAAHYEQMLGIVQRHMGDQPLEYIKGALDEVISILKSEGVKDAERKLQIESLIDRLSDADFNTLTVRGKQLTDFRAEGEKAPDGERDEVDELAVDAGMVGSGSESSDPDDVGQVAEGSEDEDGHAQARLGRQAREGENQALPTAPELDEVQGTATVIQRVEQAASASHQTQLKLADIDAQWLNRNLTKYLDSRPAEEILKLESQVLTLLGNEAAPLRVCEKKLFALLGTQRPALVGPLLKNRHTVYFGTKLQQA